MRLRTTSLALAGLCLLGVCAAGANANIVFQDTFDSYPIMLNWTGGGVWTIGPGSVDLIGVGSSWNWFPSHGRYVDMDGSTGHAGTMVETSPLSLSPGTYRLSFDLAGNQRTTTSDQVVVEVKVGLFAETFTLGWNAPFASFTRDFAVSSNVNAQLSFAGVGGDNIGALLDNVKLEAVPAPGAALLGVIGLGLVGWLRRRFA